LTRVDRDHEFPTGLSRAVNCGAALLIHNAHLKPVSETHPHLGGRHAEVKSDVGGFVG
jgi:hypothetical protein